MTARNTLWFTGLLAMFTLAAHTIIIAMGRGGNPQYGQVLCSTANLQGYSISQEVFFYCKLTLPL